MKSEAIFCPVVGWPRQLLFAILLAGVLVALFASVTGAAPAMLNTGREIDIPAERLQVVRDSPGIYFFPYPPETIFKNQIKDWTVIKLSEELGGGFLAGTSDNVMRALARAAPEFGVSSAELPQLTPSQAQQKENRRSTRVEIETSYAYRQDNLDWNIAGNLQGENPNILSELTWEDLLIHEMRLAIRTTLNRPFFLKGSIHYGVIVDGDNQDSDYAADDREMEFSRSNNSADKGSTLDGLFGAGYNFRLFSGRFNVIPLVGYSIHQQHLSMTDGYQTITWEGGPPLGSFDGLDSTYDTQWRGPWVGLDLVLNIKKFAKYLPPLSFFASQEYHWADYYAQADWNLRDDFMHPKSFEHEADGTGSLFCLGVRAYINDRWSLTFGYEEEVWSAEDGIDRVFLADATIISTRLNEVNWQSAVYQVGCSIRF